MGKWKYIRADVYKRGITVYVGPKESLPDFVEKAFSENKKLIEEVKEHTKSSGVEATTYLEEGGQSLIWVPKFPKNPKQIAIMAHEILHATFVLLDHVGVEYRYEGPNEPYTYLFEYFLNRALNEKGYRDV